MLRAPVPPAQRNARRKPGEVRRVGVAELARRRQLVGLVPVPRFDSQEGQAEAGVDAARIVGQGLAIKTLSFGYATQALQNPSFSTEQVWRLRCQRQPAVPGGDGLVGSARSEEALCQRRPR